MLLIIAVIPDNKDALEIKKELAKINVRLTIVQSKGGLFTNGSTFYIGINEERLDEVLTVIEKKARKRRKIVPSSIVEEFEGVASLPTKVEVGAATVFVIQVDQFLKF